MNRNKLTFESENLVVDYFEFKFDVFVWIDKTKNSLVFFQARI